MAEPLFLSREKIEETKRKKFYQKDHPILYEMMTNIVDEYSGNCDEKLYSTWENKSGKVFHFQSLFKPKETENLIYLGIPFKDIISLPKSLVNWFSLDEKSAEYKSIFDTKYSSKIISQKKKVIWEEHLHIPVVISFKIKKKLDMEHIDNEFWNKIPFYKPYSVDDSIVAKEFCNEGADGWIFKQDIDNQVMICKQAIENLEIVNVSMYDPYHLLKNTNKPFSFKNFYDISLEHRRNTISILKNKMKFYAKDTEVLAGKIQDYLFHEYLGSLYFKSDWLHKDLQHRLEKYLEEDCFSDNWDIKIEEEDVLKELLEHYKITTENLLKIYDKNWKERIDKEKFFLRSFNITEEELINIKKNIFRDKVGSSISNDFRDYCYVEIMNTIRPFVYETIEQINKKIENYAYIVVAGGEPMNQILDFKDRDTTTDIDTKIFLKYSLKNCKSYPEEYKDVSIQFVNYLWYEVYPEILNYLEEKYKTTIYQSLLNVSSLPEMRLFGLSFYHPIYDKEIVFKKRFTRMTRPQEVVLFTIDMKIKNSLVYSRRFKQGENLYSGFLDSPLIYNPHEVEHLREFIIKAKPKDFIILSSVDKGTFKDKWKDYYRKNDMDLKELRKLKIPEVYERDFYYISPDYAVNDVERLVRSKERKEKVEKDVKRLVKLLTKFGNPNHQIGKIPVVNDITKIKMNEFFDDTFTKNIHLDIDDKCKSDLIKKDYNVVFDCQNTSCYSLFKIFFYTISYSMAKPYLENFIDYIVNKNIYPLFIENTGKKILKKFIKYFYFTKNEIYKYTDRNINQKKTDKNKNLVCYDISDSKCYDKCGKKNPKGCNIFAYKDMNRLRNLFINKNYNFVRHYWVPFLADILCDKMEEIVNERSKTQRKMMIIELIPDYIGENSKLSFEELFDYYLIYFTGIQQYKWIPNVKKLCRLFQKIKKVDYKNGFEEL